MLLGDVNSLASWVVTFVLTIYLSDYWYTHKKNKHLKPTCMTMIGFQLLLNENTSFIPKVIIFVCWARLIISTLEKKWGFRILHFVKWPCLAEHWEDSVENSTLPFTLPLSLLGLKLFDVRGEILRSMLLKLSVISSAVLILVGVAIDLQHI